MSKSIDIFVHHVTRVEGHGNILAKVTDGTVEKIEWQVPEAPRFFEAMVRGKHFTDIQTIVSRICGICSFSHSLSCLKAIEAALGIEVSEQTRQLRTLALFGELLESHALHVGYLVAPDLLGVKSVVPLVASHPDAVKTIIRLHRAGNRWMELIGGRRTHPVTMRVGGFGKLPAASALKEFSAELKMAAADARIVAEVLASIASKIPLFERETEYVGLVDGGSYPVYDGSIGSSDIKTLTPVAQFESVVNEYVLPQSTAKWAKWHRESYAVGALSRYKLNHKRLLPSAAQAAKSLGLTPGCTNPYMNSVVQLVECFHFVEEGIRLTDALLSRGLKEEKIAVTARAGDGAGAVEAPRGVLFHRYRFDAGGICTSANLCIPTNQNHANIQRDFETILPQLLHLSQDEIRLHLEMLVRAYDPCISCSAH